MKLADLTPAERRGFLFGLKAAADRIEFDFPERLQRRQAVQAIRNLRERKE